jgi:protein ImuB
MTKPAELYACLYVREFPAQALLRLRSKLRNQPCVVVEGEPPLQCVCSLNSKAHTLGIVHGMTRVEIETFPSVTMLSRSVRQEAATKAVLLECAGTFSPRVEDQSEDTTFLCVIDIAGTEKLLGPPKILARSLLSRVQALGIIARVTISNNFHAAICLARGMSLRNTFAMVPAGEENIALASLPLMVLNLSEECAEIFSLWGICTLGMLAELPEKELIARMGQRGKRIQMMSRGTLPHFFIPLEPTFALEERMELDSPVEQLDSLLFVVSVMLEQLIVRATHRVLALASVTITLSLEGSAFHTRSVRPALPTNEKQLWIRLIHLDLEAHPPQAAILSLILSAEPGFTSKTQLGLFSPQLPEPARLDVTMALIRAIVGEDCVGRPALLDSHQPDRFLVEPFRVPTEPRIQDASGHHQTAMRQLRPAEAATVILHEQKPKAFFFRQKRYVVECVYGPWLSGGDWWTSNPWDFEQWDIVARSHDGTALFCRLVRDLIRNSWRMEALYD